MKRSERWAWMGGELDRLHEMNQLRSLRDAHPLADPPGWIELDGRRLLNLSSNHYLGLPLYELPEARESLATGATASRLVTGNDPVYSMLERDFAVFKHTEASLVFGSGYAANVGAISALVGRDDVVFSDKLNHASIVDGIVLSRAEHVRYRNRDMDHLERMLKQSKSRGRKLIVTDAVFSMDGSLALLRELVELKERYGAMLMIDEAHSGGVFGPQGEGLAHAQGVADRIDIQMGTFSKAYGAYGGYIAGDQTLIDYLVNHSRSLIYTTALPPIVVAAIHHNWQLAMRESWRRTVLLERSGWFRSALQEHGFNTGDSECQIVPLIVGGNEMTVRFSERLRESGIAAVAIRPPTVPEGKARIRFSLMATHRMDDLHQAVDTIADVGKELGII